MPFQSLNRHSREGGNPKIRAVVWIPAFAGMTVVDGHRFEKYHNFSNEQ